MQIPEFVDFVVTIRNHEEICISDDKHADPVGMVDGKLAEHSAPFRNEEVLHFVVEDLLPSLTNKESQEVIDIDVTDAGKKEGDQDGDHVEDVGQSFLADSISKVAVENHEVAVGDDGDGDDPIDDEEEVAEESDKEAEYGVVPNALGIVEEVAEKYGHVGDAVEDDHVVDE